MHSKDTNTYQARKNTWLKKQRTKVHGPNQPRIGVRLSHFIDTILELDIKYSLNKIQLHILMSMRKSTYKDVFGNVLVDITESKFISREEIAKQFNRSVKTIANTEHDLVKKGLIKTSGEFQKYSARKYACGHKLVEEMTGKTIKVVAEKEVSRPPGHPTVPTPGTPIEGTVPTPGTHNNECSNKKVIITDDHADTSLKKVANSTLPEIRVTTPLPEIRVTTRYPKSGKQRCCIRDFTYSSSQHNHSDVLSAVQVSIRWALVEDQSRERKIVYMPNKPKLKTFLEELKSLNRSTLEEKRKAKEIPVIDGKVENAERESPRAPAYPPRDFKLGQSAKYCTGANGLKTLVFDIVKGKLWVSLKEGELDELSDRIYELERRHGDLFFEYLTTACAFSEKIKKEGGNKITLRDALFDDTNIKLITEALWKKRLTEK